MKPPFDLNNFKARIAALSRDPLAPTDYPQQHEVKLLPVASDNELHARWHEAQDWCRQNVQYQQGHQWSRRMDRNSGRPVFSFSDVSMGVLFALKFR